MSYSPCTVNRAGACCFRCGWCVGVSVDNGGGQSSRESRVGVVADPPACEAAVVVWA
jgi:hypothetical protein